MDFELWTLDLGLRPILDFTPSGRVDYGHQGFPAEVGKGEMPAAGCSSRFMPLPLLSATPQAGPGSGPASRATWSWKWPLRAALLSFLLILAVAYPLGQKQEHERRFAQWLGEERTYAALAKSVSLQYTASQPQKLGIVLADLSNQAGIPIEVEPPAARLTDINVIIRDVRIGKIEEPLDEVLREVAANNDFPHEVTFQSRNGRIVFSLGNIDEADFVTRTYPDGVGPPGNISLSSGQLADLITVLISEIEWINLSGEPSGRIVPTPGGVIVTTSSRLHRKVDRLIKQLAGVRCPPDSLDPVPLQFEDSFSTGDRLLALEQRSTFIYHEMPLQRFLSDLALRFDLPIVIHRTRLEEAIINLDEPVSTMMEDVPLRVAIRNSLADFGLSYFIRNGALHVTTPEDIPRGCYAVIYPVPDLLEGLARSDVRQICDVIKENVHSDSWIDVGGSAICAPLTKGWIVVDQYEEGHEQLRRFLSRLRAELPNSPNRQDFSIDERDIHQLDAALGKKLTPDFVDTTLGTLASWLEERLGVPVRLARKHLEEEDVTADDTAVAVPGIQPAWRQIDAMLAPLNLGIKRVDDTLVITSAENAADQLEQRVFNIRTLTEPGSGIMSQRELNRFLRTATGPNNWYRHGGWESTSQAHDLFIVWNDLKTTLEVRELMGYLNEHRDELPRLAYVRELDQESAEFKQLVAESWTSPDRIRASYLMFVTGTTSESPPSDKHAKFLEALRSIEGLSNLPEVIIGYPPSWAR